MVKLKRLKLHGFKSFAHPSEFVFDTPITSIVGPNGSGKSNVVESIRFVLGEQSMKSLRGSAGTDLIYKGSGSGSTRSMNRASVSLTFDNTDRIFSLSSASDAKIPVDFDEITITREVYSDGKNSYQINGDEVRLKDIMELIASVNIGSSGHHIISQGEADRLLNSNTKERREMLEDALGLKVYQYRIRETERKLEKTADNLIESNLLRREIAPHLRFLKRQVDKIERAQQLRDELTTSFAHYYADARALYEAQKSESARARQASSTEMLELKHELEAYETRLETGTKSPNEEAWDALTSRATALVVEKNEITRNIGRIEGMIESAERTLKRLAQPPIPGVKAIVRIGLDEIETTFALVKEKLSQARGSDNVALVHKAIDASLDTLSRLVHKYKEKDPPIPDAPDTTAFEKELADLQQQYHELSEALNSVLQQEKHLHTEQQELESELARERGASRDQEHAMFALTKRFNELQSQTNTHKMREEQIDRQLARLQEEYDEAKVLLAADVDRVDASFSTSDLADLDLGAIENTLEQTRREIERTKIKIEEIGGGSGDDVMQEYNDTVERDQFLEREITDMENTVASLNEVIRDLKAQLHTEFELGIGKINTEFNSFFTLMFGGGKASLSLVPIKQRRRKTEEESEDTEGEDNEDDQPAEYGIDINVKLPRKQVQDLAMLSGGERSLTSIALLFALSQVNPPPFLVLDETDAALDEANSKKYGDMIESLSKVSQLMVVTHNRETMSRAHVLYGVTLGGDDSSQLLSVKFDDALVYAK
ncbi:AAA family ATPase [Candidatus Nomurabacteria bacterium]|nr:AAA family ATPase [Candidatus Nomurabacteria bacterium]